MFAKKASRNLDGDYASIFAKRGREYNLGMMNCPLARAQEFNLVINALNLQRGEAIIDAPSGGGYLQTFLPKDLKLHLVEVDPAPEFRPSPALRSQTPDNAAHCQSIIAPLDAMPVAPHSCDALASIAGLHHASDLSAIFREFRRVLRPSGRLAILEVDKGSCVDTFLNTFVNQYNSGGHCGDFVSQHFLGSLVEAGFSIQRDSTQRYTWDFPTRDSMVEFTRLIFGLDLADDATVLAGIAATVGFDERADGACAMNWELRLICAA